MTKSLLISIQPQHLLNILNGDKTYEVRKVVPKWVLEALERGETVEAYLYCTKSGQALSSRFKTIDGGGNELYYTLFHDRRLPYMKILNATIPCKVVIDGYVKLDYYNVDYIYGNMWLTNMTTFLNNCQLSRQQILDYGQGKDLYALRISKVEILDEVMKLGDFVSDKLIVTVCGDDPKCYSGTAQYYARKDQVLKRPPVNMMSVWVK